MPTLFSASPPPPTFTPGSLIDLSSKVYIITSFTSRTLGLAKILYNLHATVYLGCPSSSRFETAADDLKQACPDSKGHLKPLLFAAKDPERVTGAVKGFLEQEWRLDVLFLRIGTDDLLVHFALASLLLPLLHRTASRFCHPNPSIRVVWMAPSSPSAPPCSTSGLDTAVEVYLLANASSTLSPPPSTTRQDPHAHTLPNSNPSGVQHVCVAAEPEYSTLQRAILRLLPAMLQDEAEKAACSLLYAGLGPDVRSGDWVVPWGRKGEVPEHVRTYLVGTTERGNVSASVYARYEKEMKQMIAG